MTMVQTHVTVHLSGYIDLQTLRTSLETANELCAGSQGHLCSLDCGAVTGFSAAAVITLAEKVKEYHRDGGDLKLFNVQAHILLNMRRLLLLEILERELSKGPCDSARSVREALAVSARSYQCNWNN